MKEFQIPRLMIILGCAIVASSLVGAGGELYKSYKENKQKVELQHTIPVPSTN